MSWSLQVFIYGGVGPLHSDVTVAGVAKAFGVRVVSLVCVCVVVVVSMCVYRGDRYLRLISWILVA